MTKEQEQKLRVWFTYQEIQRQLNEWDKKDNASFTEMFVLQELEAQNLIELKKSFGAIQWKH